MPYLLLATLLLALQHSRGEDLPGAQSPATTGSASLDSVLPNDNRVAAGSLRGGVLDVRLEARLAAWRPDLGVDTLVTVQVFAEQDGVPRIPGPLLRAPAGTEVRVSVRNSLPDSAIVVHGLRAGTVADDTLRVPAGGVREVRFWVDTPGTYLYWATSTGSPIADRPWRDSQLTGAIVIDPHDAQPDPAERIFVMTVLDVYPSDTVRNRAGEDIWELAINGRSWPHTERLELSVGDTVRWRWLNGSYLPHPMHLHGFHFRVLSKGGGYADTAYAAGTTREAVTEFMIPGSTFRMEWVPTRAGRWLMHCHMIPHIVPFPERGDSARAHDAHDVATHPLSGMAGLVLGITTVDRNGSGPARIRPARQLRVFAQQARADSGMGVPRGYVLQRGADPRPDSVESPGSTLVLTRGETTTITVINRMREPTTVHWHGMELESVDDGVAGWSRTGTSVAPLLAPGDSFTVTLTPPRAGTFIYHTHMDEGHQLRTGLYAPLLVLHPGERHDPATDLVFTIGRAVVRDIARLTLNGLEEAPPLMLRAGVSYRLRFINILPAAAAVVQLAVDSVPLTWRPLARDGADLPPALRAKSAAFIRHFGVGETYDFEWTPDRPMDAVLEIHTRDGTLRRTITVRQ